MRLISEAVLAVLLLAGCTTIRFPLCPAIAEASYETGRGRTINRFVLQEAETRRVEIRPLSTFAADFSGFSPSVTWLSKNYPAMLCAFDPRKVVNDRETYISCMTHAPEWMRIVRSDHPESLMYFETKFRENCSALGP